MGTDRCFLITILNGDTLLRCALRMDRLECSEDLLAYPMEPENRAILHANLPLHVRNCGPIVDVDRIFAIHCTN